MGVGNGGARSALRILLERAQHRCAELGRNARSDGLRMLGLLFQVRERDLEEWPARKRRAPADTFVDQAPERVDIACPRGTASLDQLRRKVVRRPDDHPLRRKHRQPFAPGKAEVRYGSLPRAVDHHVRWLHVPMYETRTMQRAESSSDLSGEVNDLPERELTPCRDAIAERAAVDVRDSEIASAVGFACVDHRDEMAMLQTRRHLRLAREAAFVLLTARELRA